MKITAIRQQIKKPGRYSIFVDGKYAFSLSADALLEQKLTVGQALDEQGIGELKQLSDNDKIYNNVLRYIALRSRSQWEIEQYLKRNKVSPTLTNTILNKLSNSGLIDDNKFAKSFVNDRRLLRPTSSRKLKLELRQKHVADDIIQQAVGEDSADDQQALHTIIEQKRRQTRYQDNLKLMQYLSRQGFGYGDIKTALQAEKSD